MENGRTLLDVPLMLFVFVALAGMAGELRQADMPGVTYGEIIKRVCLRFLSSALFGMATLMLAQEIWGRLMISGALGIVVGLLGADVAGALYSRAIARRIGAGHESNN
ncbi:MAG: phage holin family protein [Desulfuromonadaceae bacterium]|nr:phage holin family protein [Desulfuromonadaceae bacterium]